MFAVYKLSFGVISYTVIDNEYSQCWELKPSRGGMIWSLAAEGALRELQVGVVEPRRRDDLQMV